MPPRLQRGPQGGGGEPAYDPRCDGIQGGGEDTVALAYEALREEEKGLRNSVSGTAAPREEERVPPLLTTKDLREEEEVFRIL